MSKPITKLNEPSIRQPSVLLPLIMSLIALALVLGHVVVYGTEPQPDEGTAAHLFQLLMVVQVPIILYFAATWLPRAPMPTLRLLALQAALMIAAFAPVFLLEW